MSVVTHMAHLLVKIKLLIIYEVDVGGIVSYKLADFFLVIHCILTPFVELGSAVLIAEHTERGIRCKPACILLDKCLEFIRSNDFLSFLGEDLAGECELAFIDTLVVNLFQSI